MSPVQPSITPPPQAPPKQPPPKDPKTATYGGKDGPSSYQGEEGK